MRPGLIPMKRPPASAPNAALEWPIFGSSGTYIECGIGTCAAMGTGDFTIVALVKFASTRGGVVGLWSDSASAYRRGVILDGGALYCVGDFGAGFVPTDLTTNGSAFQWVAARKQAGSNNIQWSHRDLTNNGSPEHAPNGFNIGDPGTATDIRIGEADNVEGRHIIAVVALWDSFLSQAQVESLMTNDLADTRALSPDALLPCNVAAASVVDTTGNGADATSVSGTITAVSGPSGFTF